MAEYVTQMSKGLGSQVTRVNYTREAMGKIATANGWEIGEHTYGLPDIQWWGEDVKLRIGKFCSIADRVMFVLGGNHRADWVTTYPFPGIEGWTEAYGIPGHPASRGDIVVGNDVWIASASTIISGVTIGDGAVIGGHSVVTRDVPPYTIVGGNPAEPIRLRFSEDAVAQLLEMQWWNWEESRIRGGMRWLCSGDIAGLYRFWQASA